MEAIMRFDTRQLIERLTLALGVAAVGIAILCAAAARSHGGPNVPDRQEAAVFGDMVVSSGTSGR
jgi:hypothetical protein